MKQGTVLVVDDTLSSLKLLSDILRTEGYRVLPANSGEIALAAVASQMPELILLDLRMPGIDGLEVLRRLKASDASRDIPVMILSAVTDTEERVRGLQLGAVDFIGKPFQRDELLAKVSVHLELCHARRDLRQQAEDLRLRNAQLILSNQALDAARETTEAANRAKSTFLGTMSHELHTPMNGIMGMISLARRKAIDPGQIDYLEKAMRSAQHLLDILNDILAYVKADAEQLTITRIPLTLVQILDKVQRLNQPQAAAKGLTLVITVSPELAERVFWGDPLRLEQVLNYLIGNAIAFTDSGSVAIEASLAEESALDALLRFEVRDSGCGISTEDQKRLFTAFEQIDGSLTRGHGGTGLGLAISKRLVLGMGGTIGVASTVGQGSRFWFSARLNKATE